MTSGDEERGRAKWDEWGDGCKHKAEASRQSRGAPAGGASLLRVNSLVTTTRGPQHTDIVSHYLLVKFTLIVIFKAL